jgi:hypothetical protein
LLAARGQSHLLSHERPYVAVRVHIAVRDELLPGRVDPVVAGS